MDLDTLQMLKGSLLKVLADGGTASLAERLDDLGWQSVLADDAPAANRALFEAKGETVASGDALGPVMAAALAVSIGDAALATGVVVLPASLHPDQLTARSGAGRLTVEGVALSVPAGRAAIVPVAGEGGTRIAVVPAGSAWEAHPIAGTDPQLGLVRLAASMSDADVSWVETAAAVPAWQAAVAAGRWGLSAELLGIGRHVIDSAVAYAGDRIQYGRPIGSFQAVQHRLAGAHASVVGAGHVVDEAADTGSAWVALVAKALAGRAAEIACTQAQQAYGAIGFTWEHEFHRYLRRVYGLDWLLGDWRGLEREIGLELQRTRQVPRIGML